MLACGLLVSAATMLGAQSEPAAVDWQGIEAAWTAYFSGPSEEKAALMIELLPGDARVKDVKGGLLVIDSIREHLGVLEGEMYSGNPNAIKLCFRLYTISHGNFETKLNSILGNLIAFYPWIFLEKLEAHRHLLNSLDQVLGSYLGEIADDKDAREREKKLRIQSLESVMDKSLKPLRNECIKILKKL
jgi:hypothetical protein